MVKLGAIGYQLGKARPLAELSASDEAARARVLARPEFAHFLSEPSASPYELAAAAIDKTLAVSEVAPAAIDAVVFATDSFCSVKQTMSFYRELVTTRGLGSAYPTIVSMSECANFHAALDVAHMLVARDRARNVLLLSVDLADVVSPDSRIVGDGIGVMSDAAACCIVSSQLHDGLDVLAVEKAISPGLLPGGQPMSVQEDLLLRIEANEQLFGRLMEAAGTAAGEVRKVLPSNLSVPMLTTFLGDVGFSAQQLFTSNHRRMGHCLASDCLINLHDHVAAEGADAGDTFVLYGVGPATWGAAVLRAPHALTDV